MIRCFLHYLITDSFIFTIHGLKPRPRFDQSSSTKRLHFLIFPPYLQKSIGPTPRANDTKPNKLVAHSTPNFLYILSAAMLSPAAIMLRTIVLAAIALLALTLYISTI